MGVTIELNPGVCARYDRGMLQNIAHETICATQKIDLAQKKVTISIAIVEESDIQRINRDFRGKDRVTDVISVGDYSDDLDVTLEDSQEIFLGEVILCYNYIVGIAQEHGTSIDEEFYAVYVHGMLHLLGFDHGKKMFTLQDRICHDIKLRFSHL